MSAARLLAVLAWLLTPANLAALSGTGFVAFGLGYVKGWSTGRSGCNARVVTAVEKAVSDLEQQMEAHAKASADAAKTAAAAVPPAPRDRGELERLCRKDPDCRGQDAP